MRLVHFGEEAWGYLIGRKFVKIRSPKGKVTLVTLAQVNGLGDDERKRLRNEMSWAPASHREFGDYCDCGDCETFYKNKKQLEVRPSYIKLYIERNLRGQAIS